MLEKLRELNDVLIEKNKNNEELRQKHIIIKKLLKDDNCFFKMSMEDAYGLLRELNFDDELVKDLYSELIDSTHFS